MAILSWARWSASPESLKVVEMPAALSSDRAHGLRRGVLRLHHFLLRPEVVDPLLQGVEGLFELLLLLGELLVLGLHGVDLGLGGGLAGERLFRQILLALGERRLGLVLEVVHRVLELLLLQLDLLARRGDVHQRPLDLGDLVEHLLVGEIEHLVRLLGGVERLVGLGLDDVVGPLEEGTCRSAPCRCSIGDGRWAEPTLAQANRLGSCSDSTPLTCRHGRPKQAIARRAHPVGVAGSPSGPPGAGSHHHLGEASGDPMAVASVGVEIPPSSTPGALDSITAGSLPAAAASSPKAATKAATAASVDLDVELESPSSRADAERLVPVPLAGGQQHGARRQGEGVPMPVEDRQRGDRAAQQRVGVGGRRQLDRTPSDLGSRLTLAHRAAGGGSQQLRAQAHAEGGDLPPEGVGEQRHLGSAGGEAVVRSCGHRTAHDHDTVEGAGLVGHRFAVEHRSPDHFDAPGQQRFGQSVGAFGRRVLDNQAAGQGPVPSGPDDSAVSRRPDLAAVRNGPSCVLVSFTPRPSSSDPEARHRIVDGSLVPNMVLADPPVPEPGHY